MGWFDWGDGGDVIADEAQALAEEAYEEASFIMELMYEIYVTVAHSAHQMASDSFNPGQVAVWFEWMEPAFEYHIEEAAVDWPEVDTQMYADTMYAAHEIAEQAFSMTIEDPMPDMDDVISVALAMQLLMDILSAFM